MSCFSIDITPIKTTAESVLSVSLKGTLSAADYMACVSVTGNAVNIGDLHFSFRGRVNGVVSMCCARCLKTVDIPYDEEIEFMFSNCKDINGIKDDSVLVFEGSVADFGDVVKGFITSDMPISVLCGEDCKGLCEKCGQDLNNTKCDCVKDLMNPVIDIDLFR